MTREEFYSLEDAESVTAAQFRAIQTGLLEMSNEELGEALGYNERERGRKYVQRIRSEKSSVPPSAVTAMWFLVFSDLLPAWASHLEAPEDE